MQPLNVCKTQQNVVKTNFAEINTLVTQQNWINWTNIWEIIWKIPSHRLTHKRVLIRITWFLILLWEAGNSLAV